MDRYARAHLADQTLLRSAATNAGRERTAMADLLADIAEIDARKLYRPAAYPSLFAYCVGELRLSEDAAFKRITAARAARRFPVIFAALAEGRLKLSGVCLLAARLTEDTAAELIAAAVDRSNAEIERLLAARFPQSDLLPWVAAPVGAGPTAGELAVRRVEGAIAPPGAASPTAGELAVRRVEVATTPSAVAPPTAGELAVRRVEGLIAPPAAASPNACELAVRRVEGTAVPGLPQAQPGQGHAYPRVTPLSAQSAGVQFTLSQSELDLVQYAQELLPGDVKEVFVRALKAHVRELEQRKFAATDQPRAACPRPTRSARHIPAPVRRAVWERDGGQCTFVSETGHRCQARRHIQFDHIVEVARGGEATVAGIRLLCRAHNQHAAERTFGAEFMRHKRLAAAEARAAAKGRRVAEAQAAAEARAAAKARAADQRATEAQAARKAHVAASATAQDAAACLRRLGFRAEEIRRAQELWGDPNAPLEEMTRGALKSLCPKARYGMSSAAG